MVERHEKSKNYIKKIKINNGKDRCFVMKAFPTPHATLINKEQVSE